MRRMYSSVWNGCRGLRNHRSLHEFRMGQIKAWIFSAGPVELSHHTSSASATVVAPHILVRPADSYPTTLLWTHSKQHPSPHTPHQSNTMEYGLLSRATSGNLHSVRVLPVLHTLHCQGVVSILMELRTRNPPLLRPLVLVDLQNHLGECKGILLVTVLRFG